MPIITTTRGGAATATQPDWAGCVNMAKAAWSAAVNEWIAHAEVRADHKLNTGTISGTTIRLRPGSLRSTVPTAVPAIRETLKTVRAISHDTATVFAEELWHAWTAWAAGYSVDITNAFPTSFLAVSGPFTIDTPAAISWERNQLQPTFLRCPVVRGTSTGEFRISAGHLGAAMLNRLHALAPTGGNLVNVAPLGALARSPLSSATATPVTIATTGPSYAPVVYDTLISGLATWVNNKFVAWKTSAWLTNLWGRGVVPTFAPPYVPVGAVNGGSIWGGGDNIAGGPPPQPVLGGAPIPDQ